MLRHIYLVRRAVARHLPKSICWLQGVRKNGFHWQKTVCSYCTVLSVVCISGLVAPAQRLQDYDCYVKRLIFKLTNCGDLSTDRNVWFSGNGTENNNSNMDNNGLNQSILTKTTSNAGWKFDTDLHSFISMSFLSPNRLITRHGCENQRSIKI